MSWSREPDPLLEALVWNTPVGPASGADCPTPDVLAGLLNGRLLAEEREELERHLARCESCRAVVAVLSHAWEEPTRSARPGVLQFRRPYLVAAALLAVVSLGVVVGRLLLAGQGSTDARLVAAAERLADARPDLFAGFVPLDRSERRAPPPVERGGAGPALLRPAGRILARRPALAWEGVPGARSYSVELLRADGTPLWRLETADEASPFPAAQADLEPGAAYLWIVTASGVLGESSASGVFTVVTAEEAERLEAGLTEIRARADPSLAELLAAHFALRHELYLEAERAARAAWLAEPEDPARAETLRHVLASLGSSEAERLRPGGESGGDR